MSSGPKFVKEWENECRDIKIQPFSAEMYAKVKPELLNTKIQILNE